MTVIISRTLFLLLLSGRICDNNHTQGKSYFPSEAHTMSYHGRKVRRKDRRYPWVSLPGSSCRLHVKCFFLTLSVWALAIVISVHLSFWLFSLVIFSLCLGHINWSHQWNRYIPDPPFLASDHYGKLYLSDLQWL